MKLKLVAGVSMWPGSKQTALMLDVSGRWVKLANTPVVDRQQPQGLVGVSCKWADEIGLGCICYIWLEVSLGKRLGLHHLMSCKSVIVVIDVGPVLKT